MKKIIPIIFVALFSTLIVSAQQRECGTDDDWLLAKSFLKSAEKAVPDHGKTFQVPVIIHVLYKTNDENVGAAQLLEMLRSLHNDFLALNADYANLPQIFSGAASVPKVKFVLADKLPDGTSTSGIIRVKTDEDEYDDHDMFDDSKIIAPDKYLNIYVCDYEENGLYVSGSTKKDGIVVDFAVANGTARTVSHEAGHWLWLPHIYGKGELKKCGDDGIGDTPKQFKHQTGHSYTHPLVECDGKESMFMNFMDYGKKRFFFTTDQVNRMRQTILTRKPQIRTID